MLPSNQDVLQSGALPDMPGLVVAAVPTTDSVQYDVGGAPVPLWHEKVSSWGETLIARTVSTSCAGGRR